MDTQIEIARKHMIHLTSTGERMELHDIYSDLGKTGTNFNRDEFSRMMLDIRMGEINCIIVKDLSRFGRNYLGAGNYIEKIFPFLGVRFIAVSDGFDIGLARNENKKMVMNIKNLVNDMYARDFSNKAKIHLKQRRERGDYVGGVTPYGYTCERVGKGANTRDRKLIIESETRPVVEMIFSLFIENKNYCLVARQLSLQRVNPPAVYQQTHVGYCPEGQEYKGWSLESVKRILQSATYSGTLT